MHNLLDTHCNDILQHPEFLKLKDKEHHYTSNVYNHSVRVASQCASLCEKFKLNNVKSKDTIRAALLHDFYDFDRVERWKYRKSTKMPVTQRMRTCFLFHHPKNAALHAHRVFDINERQMNAIRSHMFPFAPFPKTTGAWLIIASDKWVTVKELYEVIRKKDIFEW